MGLDRKIIFIIDEARMDIASYTKRESIRISAKIKNKIKKRDEVIIAIGVSYDCLIDLILLQYTMRDFSCVTALKFYKEKIGELRKKNENLL